MKDKHYLLVFLWLLMLLHPLSASADCVSNQWVNSESQNPLRLKNQNNRFLHSFFNSRSRNSLLQHTQFTVSELPSFHQTSTADDITIYGSLLGGYGADTTPYGIYQFPASTANPVTAVKTDNLLNANGGGTFANDRFYMINFFDTGVGGIFAYFYVYDTHTWEKISSNRVQLTSVGTDMTYDPISNKIYGCFLNSSDGQQYDGYALGIMSQENGSVTPIRVLSEPLFTLAADVTGELYGIDKSGTLLKIDKTTGEYTPIGDTGVVPAYSQSMTFDFASGRLFWAAQTKTESALYEVNTTTGKATKTATFPRNEQFGALFIPSTGAVANAPGKIQNLKIEYDPQTVGDITVSFTLPTTTFDGTPLTEDIDYIININDIDKILDTASPGTAISIPINNQQTGYSRFSVYAKNESGNGPATKIRQWIGKDNPDAVGNLKAEVSGKSIHLSWTAPQNGEHNGYMNPNDITYRIIRYPDQKTIANNYKGTSFTDTPESVILSAYWYEVIAHQGNLEGKSSSTNKILVGEAFTAPYNESFDREADFNLFTIIDANNDGITWRKENGSVVCAYSTTEPMNDWLITPPVKLSTNNLYRVKFHARSSNSTWQERLYVAFGTNCTAEAMTHEVMAPTLIATTTSKLYEKIIEIPAEGNYYFGFQSCSDAFKYNLFIDDITIEEATSVDAPVAISDLMLTAGANGEHSATISFTVPSKTIRGEAIEKATVVIRRGNSIIKQYKDQPASSLIKYTDIACEPGNNTYTVYADNGYASLETSKTIFIGEDLPGLPTQIVLTEKDGKALLTWQAPLKGQNEGYINPATLKYHVLLDDNQTVVQKDLSECCLTFTPKIDQMQQEIRCIVYAENSKGAGYGGYSNISVFGKPYSMPFKESFSNGNIHYDVWGIIDNDGNSGTWSLAEFGMLPSAYPVDKDNGLLTFMPQYENDEAYIYSGKIDFSTVKNPVLEFYYFHLKGSKDKLIIETATDGGTFKPFHTIDYSTVYEENGWRKVSLPLSSLKATQYIQIAFRGIATDGLTSQHLDAITVQDLLDYNLSALSLSCPKKVLINTEFTLTAKIENIGLKPIDANSYTVDLYRNGEKVESMAGKQINAGEIITCLFTDIPKLEYGKEISYYFSIEYNADENKTNNQSNAAATEMSLPDLPAPTGLTAEPQNGQIMLTWNEPLLDGTVTSTDNFEEYESFIISNIGNWTLADVDLMTTAYFDISWPHRGEPQAWITFNASKIGADIGNSGEKTEWAAYSGNQCLVSFIADTDKTDDWLISPRLSGKAQTISFYIKALNGYPDSYEVLTSQAQTASNRASFKKVDHAGRKAPVEWTRIEIELPEGTNFFAIRHISDTEGFALMLDDITYQSSINIDLTLEGYNIYCDGVQINTEPAKTCSYTWEATDEKSHTYNVTACYSFGESAFSNDATCTSAIDNTTIGNPVIYTRDQSIIAENADGHPIDIYSTSGVLLYHAEEADLYQFKTIKGIYFVKISNITSKIHVK